MEVYVTYERALEIISSEQFLLPVEKVSLFQALGRVLREDIRADREDPPVPVSAMDGYGVKQEDLKTVPVKLRVKGDIPAGISSTVEIEEGEAVKIFTGSVVPGSVDTVVPVEFTEESGGYVEVRRAFSEGANIRPPGENFKKGQILIEEGEILSPPEIGIAASVGMSYLNVSAKPRVGIVVTGSELVEPWEEIHSSVQIRNANAYTLYSLIKESGGEPVYFGIVSDRREETRNVISKALETCDVVVTSGGVSMGDYDFVKDVVEKLGVEILFYKVQVKPGKPVLFGKRGNRFLFGLPGFPVSVFVSFNLFVYPLIRRIQGARRITRPWVKGFLVDDYQRRNADRTEFARCNISFDRREGKFLVLPLKRQGSGVLSALIGNKALMVVPKGTKEIKKGDQVEVFLVKEKLFPFG